MICCEGCDLWYHKNGRKFYLVYMYVQLVVIQLIDVLCAT